MTCQMMGQSIFLLFIFLTPYSTAYFSLHNEKEIYFGAREVDISISIYLNDDYLNSHVVLGEILQNITKSLEVTKQPYTSYDSLQMIKGILVGIYEQILQIRDNINSFENLHRNQSLTLGASCQYTFIANDTLIATALNGIRHIEKAINENIDKNPLPKTLKPTTEDLQVINIYYSSLSHFLIHVNELSKYLETFIAKAHSLPKLTEPPIGLFEVEHISSDDRCPKAKDKFSQITLENLRFSRQNANEVKGIYRAYFFKDPKTYYTTTPINIDNCRIALNPFYDPQKDQYVHLSCHEQLCAEVNQHPCLTAINSNNTQDILYYCPTEQSNSQFHIALENLILENPSEHDLTLLNSKFQLNIKRSDLPAKVNLNGTIQLTNHLGQSIELQDFFGNLVSPLIPQSIKSSICNKPFELKFLEYFYTHYPMLGIAAGFAILFALSFDCTKNVLNKCLSTRKRVPHLEKFLVKSVIRANKQSKTREKSKERVSPLSKAN